MALSDEEIAGLAKRIASWVFSVWRDPSGTPEMPPWIEGLPDETWREVRALAWYEVDRLLYLEKRKALNKPQRRAYGLLKSFLNDGQREQLRRNRYFHVVGSAGGRYRLFPGTGAAERIEKHKSKWFAVMRYCLHDPDWVMPPADVTLGQMLHLLTDEPGFVEIANKHAVLDMLWNGEYLRRLRRRRIENQANTESLREEAA